jgi:hypothetical protein
VNCENCEKEDGSKIAYFRWGTANIGLIGCPKHVKEVLDFLKTKVK